MSHYRPVHWHEGMFLRSHHFQAEQRYLTRLAGEQAGLGLHYGWGLRSIDWDREALGNFRLVIRSVTARFRDGVIAHVPGDKPLPVIDLKPMLQTRGEIMVYLAVPAATEGRPNSAGGQDAESQRQGIDATRFLHGSQSIEDENTGDNAQLVHFRRLNLRLLFTGEDQAGYEVLPLARITRNSRAEAQPLLEESYIPPVLACDAWPPLQITILRALHDRIGKKIELLATQVTTRGITFDSKGQGDPLIFEQLRELNQVYAYLAVLLDAEGVHPFGMYAELCRITGQLAIFGATRKPPRLPGYDHDDLGGCFFAVKRQIDALLDILIEPEYKERAFIGVGLRMQVSLEPSWLESAWSMFIGVESNLDADECIRMLTRPGQLDMKVGSSDRVDAIYRLGLPGLKFSHAARPPRALPTAGNLHYFQIDREAALEEWQNVMRSFTLAFRLNENRISGDIQGQRTLTIRHGSQNVPTQFTLFVVPND